MPVATYRGFTLSTVGASKDLWQVRIKKHTLSGNMPAVKKSIDWFCDTASIIDPKEFGALAPKRQETAQPAQENFHGYVIKNDSGDPNGWYCFFHTRLLKGGKVAIQKHIEAYLAAQQQANNKK